MLSPNDQNDFDAFKNVPANRWFALLVSQAVKTELKNFVNEVKQADTEAKLYTINEVCEMFHITPATVHNWRKRGWIVGSRVGKNRYFTREELDQARRLNQIGERY